MENIKLSFYEKLLYKQIFENKEYIFLDGIIQSSNTIFDIGSHLGFFSLYVLKNKFKYNNLKIHLFEPSKQIFDKSKNILSYYNNFLIFNNFGFRNKKIRKKLFINQKKSMQSTIFRKNFLNNSKKFEICNFKRLDKYIDFLKIKSIDLVKIDVEGAEFKILNTLTWKYFFKIKNLFFEYHLIDERFEKKFDKLIVHLKIFYKNIEIIKSNYSKNLGYVLCKNL